MPIYEYGCQTCGHTFERLQKMSDGPPEGCPECGEGGEIKKLVSRSSFVLKGGGWYKDHYGLKGSSSSGASSEGGDSVSSTDSSGSSTSSPSSPSSSSPGDGATSSSSGADD